MITIGTDVSLKECKKEGYLMLDYDESKPFSPNEDYRVYRFYPDYIYIRKGNKTVIDTTVSWNDLIEKYNKRKSDLDRHDDLLAELVTKVDPNIYDLLHLADSIDSYCGI